MHKATFVVVSVPTNGSSVACNVVIWLSLLSIKFSSQRSAFSGYFLNLKYVKKVEKGFRDTAVNYLGHPNLMLRFPSPDQPIFLEK